MLIQSLRIRTPALYLYSKHVRGLCSKKQEALDSSIQFEPVFRLPSIKYISILNRLKVYQYIGAAVMVPSCGVLELLNVVPQYTFLPTVYIGLTGAALFTLATLPFRNIIGYLYISKDNTKIKISFLDHWGRRVDRIIDTDDWIPLLDMEAKVMDAIYLSPQISDGTKFKMLVRYGQVLNKKKMGQVLE